MKKKMTASMKKDVKMFLNSIQPAMGGIIARIPQMTDKEEMDRILREVRAENKMMGVSFKGYINGFTKDSVKAIKIKK